MCVCVCVYVCMRVRVCAGMHACMCVWFPFFICCFIGFTFLLIRYLFEGGGVLGCKKLTFLLCQILDIQSISVCVYSLGLLTLKIYNFKVVTVQFRVNMTVSVKFRINKL